MRRHSNPCSIVAQTRPRLCSGIGRAIALRYAQRGARLFIVGLRQSEVDGVVRECASLHPGERNVIGKAANFTNIEEMLEIRHTLKEGKSATSGFSPAFNSQSSPV